MAKVQSLPLVSKENDFDSNRVVREEASNEYVFAVVGNIGSGTSRAALQVSSLLKQEGFDAHYLKASDLIRAWAQENGRSIPEREDDPSGAVQKLQDAGNDMRDARGGAAVAIEFIRLVREIRAGQVGLKAESGKPVPPDGKRRGYVLDSIRHPDEVDLLRHVYGDAFALVGVVCDEERRKQRLVRKLNLGEESVEQLMRRDAKEDLPNGQQVAAAFHMSDAFLDNSANHEDPDGKENENWRLAEDVRRLVDIVTHSKIIRPTASETGMFHAYGSQLRSACLSRQVGAAVLDSNGNLVSTGTNDVPRAGGGVYGAMDLDELLLHTSRDERCAYSNRLKYCSNTREVHEVVDDVLKSLDDAGVLSKEDWDNARKAIATSRVKGLIEFSRAVHAEMDALLAAGRQGKSVVGASVYVTTFPCHYCARHLVAAGVDAVYFIEPYPKSLAFKLHSDSIAPEHDSVPPSRGGTRVKFAPFTGIAPRMYRRAFMKLRKLKNSSGNIQIDEPEYLEPWHLRRIGYTDLEAKLTHDQTE